MGSLRVLVRTQSFLVMKPIRAEDRSPPVRLVSGRGRKNREVRTRLTQEPRALWTMMRAGQSIVVPDLMGKDQDDADDYERSEHGLAVCHEV